MAEVENNRQRECLICGRVLSTKHTLQRHMAGHTGEKPFECNFQGCTSAFGTAPQLKTHTRIHAPREARRRICQHVSCEEAFQTLKGLEKHVVAQHNGDDGSGRRLEFAHSCTYCDRRFYSSEELHVHVRNHIGEKPYRCSVHGCRSAFAGPTGLRAHMASAHSNERPHACPHCPKRFPTGVQLREHVHRHRVASGEVQKEHICPVCQRAFATKGDLGSHTAVHSEQKPHSCLICQRSFRLPAGLRTHMQIHTGEKNFKCGHAQCGKLFGSSCKLAEHALTHLGPEARPRYACQHQPCRKEYLTMLGLKLHTMTHHGKGTPGDGEIVKPHECKYCGKAFLLRPGLITHIRTHTGEKPYRCPRPHCAIAFSSSDHLKRHLSTVHSLGFSCPSPSCGERRKEVKSLQRHLLSHPAWAARVVLQKLK